jgi:hypothetical protein
VATKRTSKRRTSRPAARKPAKHKRRYSPSYYRSKAPAELRLYWFVIDDDGRGPRGPFFVEPENADRFMAEHSVALIGYLSPALTAHILAGKPIDERKLRRSIIAEA